MRILFLIGGSLGYQDGGGKAVIYTKPFPAAAACIKLTYSRYQTTKTLAVYKLIPQSKFQYCFGKRFTWMALVALA